MPLYDHKCKTCSAHFEVTYLASQIGIIEVPCPDCGGETVKIIGGTPHIALDWKMATSAEDGHDRLAIHAGKAGKPSPHSQYAGKRT